MAKSPPPTLPEKPQAPDPDECCGSGCPRCVLDRYDEALREWEAEIERLRKQATGEEPGDDPATPPPATARTP